MKFPTIFHRSTSSRVSNDEDTSPSDLLSTPLHSSEHSYDHRARHQDDLISVISAMQESENGLYNPTRKFTYHVNNIADPMQCQSITPLVDEECRTRMLTWCSNVSIYVCITPTSSSRICILIYHFYVTSLHDTPGIIYIYIHT